MNENDTKTTEPTDKAELKQQTLTTAQAIIELLKAIALKWGWGDWVLKLLALAGIIIAALMGTSCDNITPKQVQDALRAHEAYHELTGQKCIFAVEGGK